MEPTTRRKRANGEESKRKILRAAAEVAGERGYVGTTIALISKKCGLPASSIYWHFADKDDLIAAVIEQSYNEWLSVWTLPDSGTPDERVAKMVRNAATVIASSPDFMRLSLMLSLESPQPSQGTAHRKVRQLREDAHQRLSGILTELFPKIDEASAKYLASYAIAGADGIFIAGQAEGQDIDLRALLTVHAESLIALASSRVAAVARN